MNARFPSVCCICMSSIERGDEIDYHPTLRGPQGGKKVAHTECLESGDHSGHSHAAEALENPLNEGYEVRQSSVNGQVRHHIFFRGKDTGKYAMTAEKAEFLANRMTDGKSPDRLAFMRR